MSDDRPRIDARVEARWIAVDLVASSAKDLFTWVAERMRDDGLITRAEPVVERLLEREKAASTVVTPGVALPHARCGEAGELGCSFVRLAEPLLLGPHQSDPVDCVITTVGPPDLTAEHVHVLGQVAAALRDPQRLRRLRKSKTADELASVFGVRL